MCAGSAIWSSQNVDMSCWCCGFFFAAVDDNGDDDDVLTKN